MNNARKKSPRQIAHTVISRIEGEGAFTDIVLSHALQNEQLIEKDRAFINELVRGVIRRKLYLDWIVRQLFSGKQKDMPEAVRWLLWMGLYQIEFLHVPEFAAVNESVRLCTSLKQFRWKGVVNGILRSYIRNADSITFPNPEKEPVLYLSVTTSHPIWLIERWISAFGFEETHKLCLANNLAPGLAVRPNTLRLSFVDFCKLLESESVQFEKSLVPGFIRIVEISGQVREGLLNDGLMIVQDESAGLVGLLTNPQPGETILDLCAAPGGKSTHVAALSSDSCKIVSGDVNIKRIRLLQKNAVKLGFHHIHTVAGDAQHFPAAPADVVILDAPCSGLGVLQKKPDIRWKRQPQDIVELSQLQYDMINAAAKLVRPNGRLIYSTCTIEPEENERIIERFLQTHSEFFVEPASAVSIAKQFTTDTGFIRTFPHRHRMDGSFAARLIKRS